MVPLLNALGQLVRMPSWLAPALTLAAPDILNIVHTLREAGDTLSNEQKFALAAEMVGETLDSAFDAAPEWSALDERQRDTVIAGLVELALFVVKARRAARGDVPHE